jgi:myosin heavy subunit
MGPDDRRISKILIQERDDRVKSIEELQKALMKEQQDRTRALQSMQFSIDDLSKKLEAMGQSNHVLPALPRHESGNVSALLEEKLSKQQMQIDNLTSMMQQHTTQMQDIISRTSTLEQIQRRAPGPALAVGGGVALSDGLGGNAEARLKEVEELQGQQVQQLTALRSLVVEVHVNLLLHAVKASRIALRCTDLSKEERRLALQSLDAKERLVREDISKINERFDLSAAGVLKTITADMMPGSAQPTGFGPGGGGDNSRVQM